MKPNVGKGILAGLVAGLAASWTMDRFQDIWFALAMPDQRQASRNHAEHQGAAEAADENATVKAASAISEGLFNHSLKPGEKKLAGPAVHYAVGAASGAVYGAASEILPEVTTGFGMPFGVALWLTVDEGAVPLLGLAKGPAQYPLSTHVYAFASHLVFGATVEGVRRLLRS
jgi:hypothetical protein